MDDQYYPFGFSPYVGGGAQLSAIPTYNGGAYVGDIPTNLNGLSGDQALQTPYDFFHIQNYLQRVDPNRQWQHGDQFLNMIHQYYMSRKGQT